MILFCLTGWALQRYANWPSALPVALLAGMVVAMLVPDRGACPLPGQRDSSRN